MIGTPANSPVITSRGFASDASQISTPGIINTKTYLYTNDDKLALQTTYDEYEKFISLISSTKTENNYVETQNISASPQTPTTNSTSITQPDPHKFTSYLESIRHLNTRLNYRFLELDAKLRFLRLLTAGTELAPSEFASLDGESEQLSLKIDSLETQIEEMKKFGRNLRKKIEKCFHQAEIRRCIEGKPILEDEIDNMIKEISGYRQFFVENGLEFITLDNHINGNEETDNTNLDLEWAKKLVNEDLLGMDLVETNLSNLETEIEELRKTYDDLASTATNISQQKDSLTTELEELERERDKYLDELAELENHQMTSSDTMLLAQQEILTQMVDKWKSI